MQVDCPECGASQAGSPGAEVVCPACMTPFLVPAIARAVRAFDVQPGGDAVLHGMSRHAIREAIYVGRLDAAARVRHDGGKWELIGGYPEFAAVFRLLGGDLAPMAGTRKLAGWGRGPEARERSASRAPASLAGPQASDGRGTRSDTLDEMSGTGHAAPANRATATRSPTLVPPPSKNAPPPPLPAATAPKAAAVAAAVADTEALAPAPRAGARTLPSEPAADAPAKPPWALLGGGVVLVALAAWWFLG